MLESANSVQPSARSGVPPFMVMDVMAAAARLEAQGRRIVHMEVGQPAAGAPPSSIAAVRSALAEGPHGYTETLGMAPLRRRIAGNYPQWYDIDLDAERVVVTTGSSAGFMLAFLVAFEPGDRVAVPVPGYPPCPSKPMQRHAGRSPARRCWRSIASGRSRASWSALQPIRRAP